jgi:hypothetical protein
MPGHVRAAMNWNNLKRMMGDQYSMSIVDGMKTVVCKLKDNPLGYTVLDILQMKHIYLRGLKNCHLMMLVWKLVS